MSAIYKYKLFTNGKTSVKIPLPENATVLSVQWQDNDICLWAIVEPLNDGIIRQFEMHGTGHEFNHTINHLYLSTIQKGGFVFHVFEVLNPNNSAV